MGGAVRRVRSPAEIKATERAHINWWNMVELPVAAILLGVVVTLLFGWLAVDKGDPWLFVLAALSPLVAVWGLWYLRRLGPAPKKRDGYQPR